MQLRVWVRAMVTTSMIVVCAGGCSSGPQLGASPRPATSSTSSPPSSAAPSTSTVPSASTAAPVEEPTALHAYTIAAEMAARDFGDARRDFDAVMLANLSQQRLAAAWQLMTADLGAFEHADEPIHKDVGGTTVWFVPMVFAQGSFEVQVTFDAQGLVAGLYLRPARFDATL